MNIRNILQNFWTASPQLNYLALRKKIPYSKKFHLQDKLRSNVFVLSTGRTGTLTLAKVLALSNDYLVFHEPSPILYRLSKLSYIKSSQEQCLDVFGEAFMAAREFLLNLSAELNKNYIETSPQTTFIARAIYSVLPNTKFIHVVRDPRAVVRSMMRRKWYSGNVYDKFRISPQTGQPYHDKWSKMKIFEKNIWLWAETNRWIMEFISSLPEGKALFIRAEEIFLANEDTLERLFQFIESPHPPKKKILKIIRQKLNQQLTGEFPDSALWTFEMKDQLNKIAKPIATELGYTL